MIFIAFNLLNEEIYFLVALYLACTFNGIDEKIVDMFFYICVCVFWPPVIPVCPSYELVGIQSQAVSNTEHRLCKSPQ